MDKAVDVDICKKCYGDSRAIHLVKLVLAGNNNEIANVRFGETLNKEELHEIEKGLQDKYGDDKVSIE